MLVRLILFIAILLQAAGVSTVAARVNHSLSFGPLSAKAMRSHGASRAGRTQRLLLGLHRVLQRQPQIFVYDQVARLSAQRRDQRSRSSIFPFPERVGNAAGAPSPV
jgi:hypothetical protein